MALLRILGADRVLAGAGAELPQPDQLCGPFSAARALRAVLEEPPSVTELAVASGTRIWPHDVAGWRPVGAPLLRTGWESLPLADVVEVSGTDATGLTRGIEALCPDIAVVPASGADRSGLLTLLSTLELPVGVLANVRTGPIAPPGMAWDVGHFVVLWGLDGDLVGVADTYVELTAAAMPPGCRLVDVGALASALPERGLLLLVAAEHADDVKRTVAAAGLVSELWAT